MPDTPPLEHYWHICFHFHTVHHIGRCFCPVVGQVLYGLLLGGRRADHSSQRPPVDEVEEYYREGKSLTSSMVEAILPSAAEHIQLDTLHQVCIHVHDIVYSIFKHTAVDSHYLAVFLRLQG